MLTIQMIMTHLTVDWSIVIADVTVGQANNFDEAASRERELERESTVPGTNTSRIRQAVLDMNPLCGSVRTEFIIRSNY